MRLNFAPTRSRYNLRPELLAFFLIATAALCWPAIQVGAQAGAQDRAPDGVQIGVRTGVRADIQNATRAGQNKPDSSGLDSADAVLRQMSGITGLEVKAPLKKEFINRDQLQKYLTDNLHEEYPSGEMHGEEAALKAFGVVGPGFSLEKFLVSFFTEQAAGFYDPRRKTMFMADWVAPDLQQPVLTHELTHALQDQSFDLWKFMRAVRDDDDATAAREAFVEGYATLAMMQVMLGSIPVEKLPSVDAMMGPLVSQQMAEFPVFTASPFFLRFEALFPYIQGLHFCLSGIAAGGWKRLNQVFTHPPSSTRQIFQPDLYFTDATASASGHGSETAAIPLVLSPPPALERAAGLKLVEANVMGAVGYYGLLGQLISEEEAKKLSGALTADRYLVYEASPSGPYVLIARTRWTTPEASAAFCSDYRTILAKRWPGFSQQTPASGGESAATPTVAQQQTLLRTTGAAPPFLLDQGNECRWAEGVPAAQAGAVENWLGSLR